MLRHERADLLDLRWAEAEVGGANDARDLLRAARADDRAGHRRVAQRPRDGDLTGGATVARAERILADVERAEREMREYATFERGRVVVGTLQSPESLRLPALLSVFHARYPGIEIELREESAEQLRARWRREASIWPCSLCPASHVLETRQRRPSRRRQRPSRPNNFSRKKSCWRGTVDARRRQRRRPFSISLAPGGGASHSPRAIRDGHVALARRVRLAGAHTRGEKARDAEECVALERLGQDLNAKLAQERQELWRELIH